MEGTGVAVRWVGTNFELAFHQVGWLTGWLLIDSDIHKGGFPSPAWVS